MSTGAVGQVVGWAAIAFAVIGVVTGRRWALVGAALAGAAAPVVLVFALLTGDFSLAYVAETTSHATPWPYRIAALWGGMDGSMLFYTAMTLVVGAWAVRGPVPSRTVASVGLGLLLITVFFANPFTVLDIPAVDGGGLLAILQHPAMIYHPPILYLGLTTLVVPFALTVAMVLERGDRAVWMAAVRRWLYVPWIALTVGMAAGASWAYVELGWGGYWAWDPVENTALMPWMATTVFLHMSRVEEATGRARRWNVSFAALPFALSVMGVYLTRSGATGSIHSFAENPVVGRILLVGAGVVALFVVFLTVRSERGKTWQAMRLDRNGWLALNALLLTSALVFITAGSAYPAYASVFADTTVAVDTRFFVVTVLPIAVLVAAAVTLALRRARLAYVLVVVGAAAATVLLGGSGVGILMMAPAVASVIFLGAALFSRRRGRQLGVYLAHLGMAIFLVGVAGSSFGDEFHGSMTPGEQVNVAGHEIVLTGLEFGDEDRYVHVRALFDVDGAPMSPEIRGYERQALPIAEPVLRSSVVDDVIVAISLLYPDGETVEVSAFVRPLVWWVWVGAGMIALAGLVVHFGRGGAASAPRRSATEAPQPAGRTSGSVSR